MYALYHFMEENNAGIGPKDLIKDFTQAKCKVGDEVLVKRGKKSKRYMATIIEFCGE
jgi:hypothetical protein